MKRIFTFILFIFFSTFLFAAKINKINLNLNNFSVDFSELKDSDYIVSADEDTRLIYIEILNLDKKSVDKFTNELEEKMKKSGYFEDLNISKAENALFITLQLFPKISYIINSTNKKIDLSLYKTNKNKHLIVIDPGHGGKDPGAVRGKVYEKDIVFAISKHLREELAKDFNILMTRDKDVFIKLHDRSKMANNAKAKLFVSVHANASTNTKAHGVEVFYFSRKSSPYAERIANFENSFGEKYGENTNDIVQISGELAYKKNQENSISLAQDIVDNIATSVNLRNGGIHGANFAVLRGFNGPSILIEVGFVSNSGDREIITNSDAQKKIAIEIADSIRNYFD
ncbi:MAG: N-acetylmuramoyl-L-alanine amidase [Fusobacterium sp.]|uniref:N-acetylmuramoyl-L-alanine amidase family protein n=1 Tax=Fusobacterium sp. TaxID=68766 RepID=UPI0026DB7B07|nr:N-acetylmuramoyl-L-alanine amidase [Fusobacterium sp.]MDO4690352.1 N-acetylmuramoyl-L-alanine amidase [Fusobacterium sp.]